MEERWEVSQDVAKLQAKYLLENETPPRLISGMSSLRSPLSASSPKEVIIFINTKTE